MLKLCTVASAVIALGVCLQQLDQGRRRRRREREDEAQERAEEASRADSENAHSEKSHNPAEDKELAAPNTPTTSTIPAHRSPRPYRIPLETFLHLVPGRWSWLATSGEEFCPGGPLDSYFPEAQNTTIEICRVLVVGSDNHPSFTKEEFESIMAPEVAHNHAAAGLAGDIWSYGVLVYRILVGQFPFPDLGEDTRCFDPWFVDSVWRVSGVLDTSPAACRFFASIFQIAPEFRCTAQELCRHPFFEGVDWDALAQKTLQTPILGKIDDHRIVPTPLEELGMHYRTFLSRVEEFSVGSEEH
ncbi:hypothetical protein BSKO_13022 [Bryopsis sp. KO-2023]|nr:hypothetical protein BSKO_13022 [Bryopsis sp. KO-2023]